MNKLLLTLVLLVPVSIGLWNWTSFLPNDIYTARLLSLKIPNSATNILTIRSGINAPLVKWEMPPDTFKDFQHALISEGYSQWKTQTYDIADPISLIQKITVAGFSEGTNGKISMSSIQIGKKRVRVYYDYASQTFVAIGG